MTVRFVNKETGEIREQTVFMGDFPMMTEWGTFIINGTERVIVTQLVRSPGAYLMEPKDATKQVFTANLMPSPRLVARARDRQEGRRLRPHRPEAQAADHDAAARAAGRGPVHRLRARHVARTRRSSRCSTTRSTSLNTLEKDPSTREEEALIEVFKKQRPGEPPTLDNARNLLRALFFDPKRYDLTKVGRYKLNQRLGVDVPEDTRVLTTAGHPRARPQARRAADAARRRPRTRRTSPPTRSRSTATRSAPSSTSTSTSATAGCAPSAS